MSKLNDCALDALPEEPCVELAEGGGDEAW
jgi:hypothetical protein